MKWFHWIKEISSIYILSNFYLSKSKQRKFYQIFPNYSTQADFIKLIRNSIKNNKNWFNSQYCKSRHFRIRSVCSWSFCCLLFCNVVQSHYALFFSCRRFDFSLHHQSNQTRKSIHNLICIWLNLVQSKQHFTHS